MGTTTRRNDAQGRLSRKGRTLHDTVSRYHGMAHQAHWGTDAQLLGAVSLPGPAAAAGPGVWSPTGAMVTAHVFHTATLLPTGKVLVAGEYREVSAGTALSNPRMGRWTATTAMGTAREVHTATLLPGGKVLVTGGCRPPCRYSPYATASAELYDPATGRWTPAGNMSAARSNHTATLLPNGKVLAAACSARRTSRKRIATTRGRRRRTR